MATHVRFGRRTLAAGILAAGLAGLMSGPVFAQEQKLEEYPLYTWPFPATANILADVIVANGYDTQNGFKVKYIKYGTGAAFWAGLSKGEIYAVAIGPYQFAKMLADGVPLKLFASNLTMDALVVITKDPKIKTFTDLKGKKFAATVAFAEFQYLEIYAKRLGFDLQKDVEIVNATPALAQAHFEAGRVDAIMAWEPSSSIILEANKDARIMLKGSDAWKQVTGDEGWELLMTVRSDYIDAEPTRLKRMMRMYEQASTFTLEHPDETEEIVTSNKYASQNFPKGILAKAIKDKRLQLRMKPTWDPEINKQVWRMLEVGKADGYISALPPADSVISKAP